MNIHKDTIEKIGNIAEVLEHVHKTLQRKLTFNSPGYRKNKTIQELDDILVKYATQINPDLRMVKSSMFYTKRNKDCAHWHVDEGWKLQGMVIAAWKYPTEILLKKIRQRKTWRDCRRKGRKKDNAEILIPEPGDVYLLGADVIHRTSPQAIGKRHLVGRVWLHDSVGNDEQVRVREYMESDPL